MDWNKLKVPELKAELKNRGLAQTGLKAALVARLVESDNATDAPTETPADETPSDAPVSTNDLVEDGVANGEPKPEESAPLAVDSAQPTEQPASVEEATSNESKIPEEITEPEATVPVPSGAEEQTVAETSLSTEAEPQLPQAEFKEVIEDNQKRKRRSQSPPPSAVDTPRKRARQDQDLPLTEVDSVGTKEQVVITKDDADWVEKNNAVDSKVVNEESAEVAPSGDGVQPGPTIVDVSKDEVKIEPVVKEDEMKADAGDKQVVSNKLDSATNGGEEQDAPTSKQRDHRFRELYSKSVPAQEVTDKAPPQHDNLEPGPERAVSPAIHPATAALYIRDFMRPLNPAHLKEYLINLATAPGSTLDADILVKFYIDPIRTHSFVLFTNISAASRVRSEIHDRIWPDERTRKPLWADFIPAERVQEWIDEEQSAGAGDRRGISTKKWEVVYDVGSDRSVTATLQETGAVPALTRRPSAQAPPAPVPSRSGVEGAPLGPRAEQGQGRGYRPPPIVQPPAPLARNQKATTAKPVIYYQPVDPAIAERRLDAIDDLTTKNPKPGNEINRYTFEDGVKLVDRGPEIFSGIRPPSSYRSRGGGGGFRGRGGGGDRYFGSGRDFREPPRDSRDYRDRDRDRNRDFRDARDRDFRDFRQRDDFRDRDRDARDRRYY